MCKLLCRQKLSRLWSRVRTRGKSTNKITETQLIKIKCYCDSKLQESLPAAEEDCSFSCPGKASDSCGAGDRLNVYHKQGTSTPSTTSSPAPLPTTYTFQNCYSEATNGRALELKYTTSDAQTVENCAAACVGYKYFGLEYYFGMSYGTMHFNVY